MIKQQTVLTASSIAIEKVNPSVALINHVNSSIVGLCSTTLSMEGYTLDNIAVELPKNTNEDSEHSSLQEVVVKSIAPIVRQSLSAISEYVIPTCDRLEKALSYCYDRNKLIDYVFNKFVVQPHIIDKNLFDSIIFDIEPDADLLNGVLYTPIIKDNEVSFPDLTAEQIRNIVKDSLIYPEIKEIFSNDEDVVFGFKDIWDIPYFIHEGRGEKIDVKTVRIIPINLNRLIITNIILHKLSSDENPLEGIVGIDLDKYNNYIASHKRFIKTVLYLTKERYKAYIAKGIDIDEIDVKYEEEKNEYEQFYKARVLTGNAKVIITKEMVDYFNNTEQYSLTEMILGMVLGKVGFGENTYHENLIERFPLLNKVVQDYYQMLTNVLNMNIRISAKNYIREVIVELANGNIWKDYLDSLEGFNNVSKLEKILNTDNFNYNDILTTPHFVSEVINKRLRIANTLMAVNIAKGIGAPIAAEILEENINEDCSSAEKQRKVLAKAITMCVVRKLLA